MSVLTADLKVLGMVLGEVTASCDAADELVRAKWADTARGTASAPVY